VTFAEARALSDRRWRAAFGHADVARIFANEDAIKRLIGGVLMEQSDAWKTQNRSLQIEGLPSPQSRDRRCK
jgi:hypothetical protein